VIKLPYNLFVTSKLNVTAKKKVAEPHKRIEPMDGKKKESEWFPKVVFTANMSHFVRYNVLCILIVHTKRKIDLRLYDAEYKGRYYLLALIDIQSWHSR
jgi:hypothetical protein